MAALKVKRHWWTKQMHPTAPEPSMFRVLSHRWKPVVRRERNAVPLHLALAMEEEQTVGRAYCGPHRKASAAAEKLSRWNPWLWIK